MNALTVTLTWSGFLLSGRAVLTTWSTSALRWGFPSCRTAAHRSGLMRSTTYRACTLNRLFRLVTSTNSRSHWPRL